LPLACPVNRPLLPDNLTPAATEPFSERAFRDALGRFATGVAVVTAVASDGAKVGLTISSFNSASLTPPLVLWSLMKTASSMPVFSSISHYAVNVLGASQKELAMQFSRRNVDRWAGVDYQLGASGAPLLAGAIASFECHNRSRYDEGDHVILVGEVQHCHYRAGVAPLLYHGGQFYTEQLL
jgi:flavin reductase (DIM6/NTAB) family NADH-FMN oxidoreductase RutF